MKKGTLTLKTLAMLYQEANKKGIAGNLIVERFEGVVINFKFPFIHRLVAIKLNETRT